MKYPTLQFCDCDRERIEVNKLTNIFEQFNTGISEDYELSQTPALIIKRGSVSKTFKKCEIDFLKEHYGCVDYDEVPDDELFKWNRYTGKELVKLCKESFLFAALVELNMKCGQFYVYEHKDLFDDLCVLIYTL